MRKRGADWDWALRIGAPVEGAAWVAPASPRPALSSGHRGHRRLLAGPVGTIIARPWADRLTLDVLKRGYFPLSRLWAAGMAADGDLDAFWAGAGQPRRHEYSRRLDDILARVAVAKAVSAATDQAWTETFFGETPLQPSRAVAMETARLDQRHMLNGLRRLFLPIRNRTTPRARIDIAPPSAAFEQQLAGMVEAAARPRRDVRVEVSHPVAAPLSDDRWLRFVSPATHLGDTALARVHTPRGVIDPPTVILGHGICVEFDHWQGLLDETDALLAGGIRVIRPEAPWHGRRTPSGYYGGERAIGMFPSGMPELMLGAVAEWAVIADWARATSNGPLGFGGTSLGALTAQLAASMAHDWPAQLQPEALYLMTHSADMSGAMTGGVLASLFADQRVVEAKGWTPDLVRRTLRDIDPLRAPVTPPSRIVSVLGQEDVITPFAGGDAAVRRWGVPDDNVFISRNGHFTIPMTLMRNRQPTQRFADILSALKT